MKSLFSLTALACLLLFPLRAPAADDPKPAAPAESPKAEKKAKGAPFNGTVSAVDKTAKTVTLGDKEKARIFQITSETKIRKDKKPGVFDDIVVGERVGGYTRENAEGKSEVVTLNVGLPAKAKGKKKTD